MEKIRRKQFTFEEKTEILNRTHRSCAHCGMKLDENTLTIEHIFPLDKGGDNSEFNIVALCSKCNNEKSNWIYDIYNYYIYLDIKYVEGYSNYFYSKQYRNKKDILGVDIATVFFINTRYQQMLSRIKDKHKYTKGIVSMSTKISIVKAYEGDASSIYKFICREYKEQNEQLPDNISEYSVLNNIKRI